MALHFYLNGTTGKQDGVEISNGDLSNPLLFDGFYAASGDWLSKTKTIHIRADAGETWKVVVVSVVDSKTSNVTKFVVSIPDAPLMNIFTYSTRTLLPYYPSVSDVNLPINITAWVHGGETSPSISAKIAVIGGIKI